MVTATARRPLPSWATDLIAFGIPDPDDDARPKFRATHLVACSAVANGWDQQDYINQVMDGIKAGGSQPSKGLWDQLTTRRRRKVPRLRAIQLLEKAWRFAQENIARGFNPEREKDILAVAEQWSHAIGNPEIALSRSEALVLDYVIGQVTTRKYRKVTCPGLAIAEYTGLSHKGAVDALTSLRERGIIVRHSKGTWVGTGNKGGKAAIYSLADPRNFFSLRGTQTLHAQNRSDQHFSGANRPSGTHTDPLRGEGMYTYSTSRQKDRGQSPPGSGHHHRSDTVGGGLR